MNASDGFSESPPLIDQLKEVSGFRERTESKATKSTSTVRRNQVYKGTKALYVTAGKIAEPFHTEFGVAIQVGANDAAEAWDELAAQNPKIKQILLGLLQGTAWAKLVTVHLQMALPFIATSENVPDKMRVMAQSLMMMQMEEKMRQMSENKS